MFVVTIDQRGSRHGSDRVPELLAALAGTPAVLAFERTVGDEVQGVLDAPDVAVDVALEVVRDGGWSVGIGAGPVDVPLPDSPRSGSGPAFLLARDAVEAAKSRQRPLPVAVRGVDPQAASDADALLVLLGAVGARRTPAGWDAVDARRAAPEGGQDAAARTLGVSQQAVSQRLRAAMWAEEAAVRPVAARLLAAAAGTGTSTVG